MTGDLTMDIITHYWIKQTKRGNWIKTGYARRPYKEDYDKTLGTTDYDRGFGSNLL